MDRKIAIILKAVESSMISAVRLNPSRKGADITELKRGGHVGEKQIERIWDKLQELITPDKIAELESELENLLERELPNKLEKKMPNVRYNVREKMPNKLPNKLGIEKLGQQIVELEGEVKLLHKEIEELRKETGKTTGNQTLKNEGDRGYLC